MSDIFKGQTRLTIKLYCQAAIPNVDTALIKYLKPTGIAGSFPATVEDADAGIISYDVADANDIDEFGTWKFWPHITFTDTKVIIGKSAEQMVLEEGS